MIQKEEKQTNKSITDKEAMDLLLLSAEIYNDAFRASMYDKNLNNETNKFSEE